MSLIEVMVSLFIVAMTALAVVPMFALATSNNATGADDGMITGIAMEQLEALLREDYHHLSPGGSLTSNVDGYFFTDSEFLVRWQIEYPGDPVESKLIQVRVIGEDFGSMPGREKTLITLRARP